MWCGGLSAHVCRVRTKVCHGKGLARLRMPEHITARLQQMADHPDSEWEDPDLMKLAA
jgi:hypothetical protein